MSANANNFPDIKYKNIKYKGKISYNSETNTWSNAINKNADNYFTKVKGFGDAYDYEDKDRNFAFSTDCEYEFIYNGSLIGYSNRDLKFYDITYANGGISKRPLTIDEIQAILPDYNIITLSQFSKNTNAFKIKKHVGDLKILLYNDTDNTFSGYSFYSGNAKFKHFLLKGFIVVQHPGMIQFSDLGSHSYEKPCYVLLVR